MVAIKAYNLLALSKSGKGTDLSIPALKSLSSQAKSHSAASVLWFVEFFCDLWKCFDPMEEFCPYEHTVLDCQKCILQIQRKNQVMFVYHILQSLPPMSLSPCACSRPTSPSPHVPMSPRPHVPTFPSPTSPRPRVPRPTSQSPSPRLIFSHSLVY